MTVPLDPKQVRQLQRWAPAQLKCGWERPSDSAREITGLAKRFALEIGHPQYEPDWGRIFEMERAGAALVWGVRAIETNVLVGYLGCTFNKGLFTGSAYTRIEAGYLAPEWRGPLGWWFIKVFANEVNGAIEWETNDAFEPDEHGRSRLATLLERLGFAQVGTVMRRP